MNKGMQGDFQICISIPLIMGELFLGFWEQKVASDFNDGAI